MELLLLLLAWAATFSLVVILPWIIIRLTVRVLEADLSKRGDEYGHAPPRQPSDPVAGTPLSQESDEPVEPDTTVPAPTTPSKDADR